MGGYLDKVKELEQSRHTQGGDKEPPIGAIRESGVSGVPDEVPQGPPQQEGYCEISELSEKRAALRE